MNKYSKDNYLIARIGGDEYAIVMPQTTESEAETVINTINTESNRVKVKSINLSISFGYKSKTSNSQDIQEVYRGAEDLMYRQKLIEIPSMRSGAIETILNTLYEKDKNSELHSRIVSRISANIAKAYGMNSQDVAEVKTAGLLHDIGKIIIPSEIIIKDGKLTIEEYETIKNHSEIGFRILNSTQDMRSISDIVLNHHERMDGKGYPRGIKGNKIPIKSRIIAIADAFDAMTSERTYRDIISKEEALQEIMDNAGSQFDLKIAKVFQDNFQEIIQ
jgi:putative nucleotidyltransferase with HDIG domain